MEKCHHRFLRLREVLTLVGFSRAHVYRLVKAGTFPNSIKIGDSARWLEHEVLHWMEQQIAVNRELAA